MPRNHVTVLLILLGGLLSGEIRAQQHPDTAGLVCLDCHTEQTDQPIVHAPVSSGDCQSCHQISGSDISGLKAEGTELCVGCHEKQKSHEFEHMALQMGDCLLCHEPHQSQHGRLLKTSSGELCSLCHTGIVAEQPFQHGPAAAGACVVCHDPHGSDQPQLLLEQGSDLCLQCHEVMAGRLAVGTSVHSPVAANCATCHDPHAANFKYQLKMEVKDLCVACHTSIDEQMHLATDHAATIIGKRCLNCHDPHTTGHAKLLQGEVKDLCLSCHNTPIPSVNQGTATIKMLTNMKELLEQNPDHHGPIRDNNCAACHQPHGSENFRLLFAEYPSAFYTDFDESKYGLCFTCHDPAFVREAKTTTLTGFRKGDQNLHYVHVNRATKGRTCRACHETHASTYPFHIRTSLPYGKWEMPIKYQRTESGGTCLAGCHEERQYSREQIEGGK